MASAYDQFLKNLAAITEYRVKSAMAANALSRSYAAGSQNPTYAPDARQLALEAMGNHMPTTTPAAKKDSGFHLHNPFDGLLEDKTMLIPIVGSWLHTSPGKTAVNEMARGKSASAEAAKTAVENAQAGTSPEVGLGEGPLTSAISHPLDTLKALFRGAKENKTGFADVAKTVDPNISDRKAGIIGFAGDVALDPLSYVAPEAALAKLNKLRPVSNAAKLTEAAAPLTKEAAVEAAAKAAPVAAPATAGPMAPKAYDFNFGKAATGLPPERIAPAPIDLPVVKGPRTHTVPDFWKYLEDRPAHAIMYAMRKVPVQRPIADIPAPFNVTETVREVKIPNKTAASNSQLGVARAVKAALLNNPETKIGSKTIGEYLAAVRSGDIPAEAFNKNLDKYVMHILKTKQHGLIPKEIPLSTAKGAVVGKAEFKPLADLFSTGKIPSSLPKYDEAATAFTQKFAVHSPEDLKYLYVTNARGERVSLADYLSNLGVAPVKTMPEIFAKPRPMVPEPKFRVETIKTTKTTKFPLSQLRQWVIDHSDKLSQKELRYLANSRSADVYAKRLQSMAARTITRDFNNIDEFVAAAKAGIIPKESIQQMLDLTGAKTIDELADKAKSLIRQLGKPKRSAGGDQVQRLKKHSPQEGFDYPTGGSPASIEEKINRVAAGDKTPVERVLPDVKERNLLDLSQVLPQAVIDNLITPQMKEKYPWVTSIKKAKRTHRTPGEGRARNLYSWGSMPQYEVWKGLINRANSDLKTAISRATPDEAKKLRAASQSIKAKRVLDNMRLAEQALRMQGVKLVAGNDTGLMLSMMDVIDSLPAQFVLDNLFTAQKDQVYITHLHEAAATLASAEIGRGSKDVAKLDAIRTVQQSVKSEEKAKAIVKAIRKSMPDIMARVEANYAEHSIKLGEAVTSMTDEVIGKLIFNLTNPNVPVGAAFQGLMDRHKQLAYFGHTVKAPADALTAAKDLTDIKLSAIVTPGDLNEANMAKGISTGADDAAKTTKGVRQQAARASEAAHDMRPGDTINDVGDDFDIAMQWGIARANVPILDKVVDQISMAFTPHFGHEDLHNLVHVEHNTTQSFARTHRALMQEAHDFAVAYGQTVGKNSVEAAQEAMRIVQDPKLVTGPMAAELQPLVKAIQNSVDLVFGGDSVRASHAVRNGIFTRHFNKTMDYYGVPGRFRFDPKKPIAEQATLWRSWSFEDPLSEMDKIHGALQRATVEVTIGRDFSSRWGSATRQPGFVKLIDSSGKNSIFPYIDTQKWYPKEIAQQLEHLDRVMKETYSPSAPLTKFLDTVIHSWKAGMTIYRPGHHIRNAIGDLMFNWLAGVNDIRVYNKAAKIMSGRNAAYQTWDGLKALEAGKSVAASTAKDTAKVFTTVGGKRVALEDDAVWRAAFDQGLLPDFRVLEDININDTQAFSGVGSRSITRPLKGKGREFAGHVSMARDHYIRISHFINEVQKGSFKTLDEAFAHAGAQVRKWHPDGSDLTAFERKYMRRVIPFYSWMRKAVPLIVESMVMRPGKVMVVPKAMYNFAISNGIDPESLGNPFPTDQLFPSWMTQDILGPQWRGGLPGLLGTGGNEPNRYHGFNPGDPVSDILSGIMGRRPDQNILGSLNPLIKMPIELSSGNQLGTGASIPSTGEYLDSQIPGLGPIANIANRSIVGGLAPQTDVAKGNQQGGIDPLALFNYLTGLGIRDYSKPNYIRGAENELKYKIGELLRKQQNG